MNEEQQEVDELRRSVEMLERENERLRKHLGIADAPIHPAFDAGAFRRALAPYFLMLWLPFLVVMAVPAGVQYFAPGWTGMRIGPVPVVDISGNASGMPGIGLGIIAFGGLSIGAIACGGGAVGLVAVGGGALGLVALGGGAVGVIAVGGGAVGYIAMGGGGVGRYVLGGGGRGRAVFSYVRQDPEAVEFFCRYLPRLRRAFASPLPVVLVDGSESGAGGGDMSSDDGGAS
jgi:hypothetical protein